MSTQRPAPKLTVGTLTFEPVATGVTRATRNNRTCNVRIAMEAAQEAMGKIEPGESFETIAYPGLGIVLVRRAR